MGWGIRLHYLCMPTYFFLYCPVALIEIFSNLRHPMILILQDALIANFVVGGKHELVVQVPESGDIGHVVVPDPPRA